MNESPVLSVVVPSVNGGDILLRCLDALDAQKHDVRLEILLPERVGAAVRALVAERHPQVRILPVEAHVDIPRMRGHALRAARGEWVAIIEDHVLVPPGWARALISAGAEGHDVVGGGVANGAVESLADRAAFLCEYGHLLTPQARGRVDWVTGNNTLYRRALLVDKIGLFEAGHWEDVVHEALKSEGVALEARPEIEVEHRMHHSAGSYTGQRFLYSRAWAGARADSLTWAGRMRGLLKSFLLPPVLLVRIVKEGVRSPEYRRDSILSLPLLVLFTAAWAAGEACGYLFGPGSALSKVR